MKKLSATLAALALLGIATPALAQSRIALPVGEWDDDYQGKSDCKRPFLKIEPAKITVRMTGGEGHCAVLSLKKQKGIIWGRFDCKWDKTIPPEEMIEGDGDSNGFSIKIKSTNSILYNNGLYNLCPNNKG